LESRTVQVTEPISEKNLAPPTDQDINKVTSNGEVVAPEEPQTHSYYPSTIRTQLQDFLNTLARLAINVQQRRTTPPPPATTATATATAATGIATSGVSSTGNQTEQPAQAGDVQMGEGQEEEPGEEENEEEEEEIPELPPIDPAALKLLKDMGFSEEAVKKALYLNKMDTQPAMEWLLEHSEDSDLSTPLTNEQILQITGKTPKTFIPDPIAMKALEEMGFPKEDIVPALRATNNNQEAAAAWLLGEKDPMAELTSVDENNPFIRAIMTNPTLQAGLTNSRVLAAFQSMIDNPSTSAQYFSDPEVGPVLLQAISIFNATS